MDSLNTSLRGPCDRLQTNIQDTLSAVKHELTLAAGHLRLDRSVNTQEQVLARVRRLRELLQQKRADEQLCQLQLEARVRFREQSINTLGSLPKLNDSALHSWDSTQVPQDIQLASFRLLDVGVAEYMSAQGHSQEYCLFRDKTPELPLDLLCDGVHLQELAAIGDALHRKDRSLFVKWCNEHRGSLKKLRTPLEYLTHVLRYSELLCGEGDQAKLDAIHYAQQHLAKNAHIYPEWRSLVLAHIIRDRSFSMEDEIEKLYLALAQQFTKDYITINGLSQHTFLVNLLRGGAAALHERICDVCLASNSNKGQQPNDCPTCDPRFAFLTRKTPHASHSFSRLGKDPYMLRNGHIHDLSQIKEASKTAGLPEGQFVDPCTYRRTESIRQVYPS